MSKTTKQEKVHALEEIVTRLRAWAPEGVAVSRKGLAVEVVHPTHTAKYTAHRVFGPQHIESFTAKVIELEGMVPRDGAIAQEEVGDGQ